MKINKQLGWLGLLILCGSISTSCQKKESVINQHPEVEEIIQTEGDNIIERLNQYGEYVPTIDQVKYLGRTLFLEDVLWFSHSATGVEFAFSGSKCEITLLGDSSAGTEWGNGHEARVAIYVNDNLVEDVLIDTELKTLTAYEGEPTKATIRVVKLSESADSTVGIRGIKFVGESISPTEEKDFMIEFIGDSITCGYGVDGLLEDQYSTSNENGTKTYAYLAAKALGADYSMVCISGFGILSGYTSTGDINKQALLPKWYNKFGASYGVFGDDRSPSEFDFVSSLKLTDLVVINLGTNDYTYCGKNPEKGAEFAVKYVEFLKQVRDKNPEATILCTLGILGDGLFSYIEEAVKQYCDETGDLKVSTFKFAEQLAEDGYGVDWHPSAITHEKVAAQLVTKIEELGLVD